MKLRSVWAVVAGILFVIVVTTLVDVVLHLSGVYPPVGQPLTDALAVLATAYRVVIGVAGAWLTAKLAPGNPMLHRSCWAAWARCSGSWAFSPRGTAAWVRAGTRSCSPCSRSRRAGREGGFTRCVVLTPARDTGA